MIENGEQAISNFVKLLFMSKNVAMKTHLMELFAAIALYSKGGYRYLWLSLNIPSYKCDIKDNAEML
jgi:hypothetical protein